VNTLGIVSSPWLMRWSTHYTAPHLHIVPTPEPRRERSRFRHWERCVACDHAFDAAHPPRRWYGLCGPCYAVVPEADLAFYNSVTQRWRKAARTDFGKGETDVLTWRTEPSPIQIMLLRLVERFGLSTRPGTEGTRCEGVAIRLGLAAGEIEAAIRGDRPMAPKARERMVRHSLAWLAADARECELLALEWGDDDDDDVDPDDPVVIAVAAALRHELGRSIGRAA